MSIQSLQKDIIHCRKCPRLVKWRIKTASEKVKRFTQEDYWGRPLPSFGDPKARVLLVGLAPAAHGGNRTGRMFTGDRSGDWLFRALHKAGFANQAESLHRSDGLKMTDCYITAACRCAPPQNKLLPIELQRCQPYFLEELRLLKNIKVIIGLGKVGFEAAVDGLKKARNAQFPAKPKFGHGLEYQSKSELLLIGCYHPSQQNTFTGKLTEKMLDDIIARVRELVQQISTKAKK